MTIVLEGELEARVREVAARRGVDPESLVLQAVEGITRTDPWQRIMWNGMTVDQWVRSSREWIHDHEPWPRVPEEALTREGIYGDHP